MTTVSDAPATASVIETVTTRADGRGVWHADIIFTHTLSESDPRPAFNVNAQLAALKRAALNAIVEELAVREQIIYESFAAAKRRIRSSTRIEIEAQNIDSLNRWHGISFREVV